MNTSAEPSRLPGPLVTTDWLFEHLDDEALRIVDCSVVMRTTDDGGYTFVGGREEWQSGHIPGSAFIDVLADLADRDSPLPMMMPAPEAFAEVMGGLGVGDDTCVVLYDRSNHAWAARVWWMLRVHGFDAAAVLDGGWRKWTAEARPESDAAPSYGRAAFSVDLRPQLIATKAQVLAEVGRGGATLINSLSPEEHSGASSRFARRGRIPGSINVYCQDLVHPETYDYLPLERLRERFSSAGPRPGEPAITYCGAGIAASSDALALTALGFEDVAVYDGSLAEWTADPDLPMETD